MIKKVLFFLIFSFFSYSFAQNFFSQEIKNFVIIGGGPAGLSAANCYGNGGIVFMGGNPGGALKFSAEVRGVPGFSRRKGSKVMDELVEEAKNAGSQLIYENIVEVDFSKRPFRLKSEKGKEILATNVFIATGTFPKKLNIPGEKEFKNKGVHYYSAVKVGHLYKDKIVAVVGGGNSALNEALHLVKCGVSKVFLIVRGDNLRAKRCMQKELLENSDKIEILYRTEITEIFGDKLVGGLNLVNNKNGKTRKLSVEGLFVAIGGIPNTNIFKEWFNLAEDGSIPTKGIKTSIPGVYVGGDIVKGSPRDANFAIENGVSVVNEILGNQDGQDSGIKSSRIGRGRRRIGRGRRQRRCCCQCCQD